MIERQKADVLRSIATSSDMTVRQLKTSTANAPWTNLLIEMTDLVVVKFGYEKEVSADCI